MALSSEFIENLKVKPICPYCGGILAERHSRHWTGTRWSYLAIEFRCDTAEELIPTHHFVIRARSTKEWEEHMKRIKLQT